jgi:hypothetical protein
VRFDNRVGNLVWVACSKSQVQNSGRGLRLHPGTENRGSRNGMSKFSEFDVITIRSLAGQVRREDLAHKYGVTARTIYYILARKTWFHI